MRFSDYNFLIGLIQSAFGMTITKDLDRTGAGRISGTIIRVNFWLAAADMSDDAQRALVRLCQEGSENYVDAKIVEPFMKKFAAMIRREAKEPGDGRITYRASNTRSCCKVA